MPAFRYRAVSSRGGQVSGVLDCDSAEAAIVKLQGDGAYPIVVAPVDSRSMGWAGTLREAASRPSQSDRQFFYEELGALLESGLPLDQTLQILTETRAHARMRSVIQKIRNDVRGGLSLADALCNHPTLFPVAACGLVRTGEESGKLGAVLLANAESLGRAIALRQTLLSTLAYPAVLIVLAGMSLVFVLVAVLPEFETMLAEAGAMPPASSALAFAISRFVRSYGWAWAIVSGILLVLAVWGYRRPSIRDQIHRLILGLPILGDVVVRANTSQFCRSLATLADAGMPLDAAIAAAAATVWNGALKSDLAAAAMQVREGRSLAHALAESRRLPATVLQLVRVGEESGRLAQPLKRLADSLGKDAERTVSRLISFLVPAIMVFVGLVIAAVISTVFSALMSINELAA